MYTNPILLTALRVDAAASLAAGVLTCALARPLSPVIGTGSGWLVAAGLFMLAYGLAIGTLSQQRAIDPRLAWMVVVGNLLWVAGSVWLAFSDLIAPTRLGIGLLLGQAAAVAAITALQFRGVRISAAAAST